MHLGLIIKQYRDENKLSMAEFAEKAKISKAYVSVLEKNKDPRNGKPIVPSIPMIQNVANAMGISFEELFNSLGDNEMVSLIDNTNNTLPNTIQSIVDVSIQLETPRQHNVLSYAKTQLDEQQQEQHNTIGISSSPSVVQEEKENYVLSRVIVTEAVAAGRGYFYGDDNMSVSYTIEEDLPSYTLASYVVGDSMMPEFEDGDVALIRECMYNHEDVYVVIYGEKSYIKKVKFEQKNNRFVLSSFNKKYDDIFINMPSDDFPVDTLEKFKILGRVVGKFKPVSPTDYYTLEQVIETFGENYNEV